MRVGEPRQGCGRGLMLDAAPRIFVLETRARSRKGDGDGGRISRARHREIDKDD